MTPADIRNVSRQLRARGCEVDAELIDALAEVYEASKPLSIAAQTTGGVAGRDEILCEAIRVHAAALARVEALKL